MQFHVRCLCDAPAGRKTGRFVADVAKRSKGSDPTGTLALQRRFASALDQRWKQLRKIIPDAVAHKTSAVNIISHAASIGDDPVRAFQAWIDEAMRQLVLGHTGSWTLTFVRQAGDMALLRAQPATQPRDRIPQLQTLCVTELQGICEAVSQQAVRAFGHGLLTEQPVSKIVRSIQQVIDTIGVKRGRLLVQFFVVRTFGAATLDSFRASGVSHVGTVAERVAGGSRSPRLSRDAKPKSYKSIIRAENKLKRKFGEEGVDVLTAGDDDVCIECQDISDNGPYTLDHAEGLIPAHPKCRCAFVPADLEDIEDSVVVDDHIVRLSSGKYRLLSHTGKNLGTFGSREEAVKHEGEVEYFKAHDGFDPDEPRDKDGKWTSGGASIEDKIDAVKTSMANQSVKVYHEVDNDTSDGQDNHTLSIEHGDATNMEAAINWHKLPIVSKTVGLHKTHYHVALKGQSVEPLKKSEPALDPNKINMSNLTKVSGKKGSNEGGVYDDPNHPIGKQYYIKQPASPDHVQNELIAAKLYQLAGVKTLKYVPVEGGNHVATELEHLDKNNVSQLDPYERDAAKSDFAVHAWLANWDAAGTGGDNIGVRGNGDVVTLDTGGSLKYRAQGEPKGEAFGNKVNEINTLRDPKLSHDAAALYGDMTNEQIVASIKRVTNLPNDKVWGIVMANGGDAALATKLLERKSDLAKQAYQMQATAAYSLTTAAKVEASATPEVKIFKTKMEHAKHLLMKGTTSEELKAALNWPSIGVPKTAADLGLTLEKSKKHGKFFYKGTPIVPEAAPAHKTIAPAITPAKYDINTPHGNFALGIATASGVDPKVGKFGLGSPYHGQDYVAVGGINESTVSTVAKYHPQMAPIPESSTIYAKAGIEPTAEESKVESAFDPEPPPKIAVAPIIPKTAPTEAELAKAKKNTKLTAQYVPGAPADHPEAEKLIAAFNAKYEGKDLSAEELSEKVHAFKQLQSNMVSFIAEHQKAEAIKQTLAKADVAAKKAAAAKAAADKIANLHNLPEEEQREYWLGKATSNGSHYLDEGEQALANPKKAYLKEAGVTPAEVGFIKAFTGSHSHVNEAMRDGHMTDEVFAFKHIMNDALDKMPKFTGDTVWRKIMLTPDQQSKYVPGQIAEWKAFNSTSKNEKTWSGNTHFTIRNPKTGVDVQKISSNPSEAEVIMPANTFYKVLSNKKIGNETHIEMEEVLPFGKSKKKAA